MSATASTKRDVIVAELRRLIISGELPRDSRLPQDELARRFESSITPVREALRVLEADKLVVSEPHKGVRVAGIDFGRVTATYVVRRLTECYAIQHAAIRLSPLDLRHAEELMVALDAAMHSSDAAATRELNQSFHYFFYARCGLPALMNEIDELWRAFPWDLMLSSTEASEMSSREHREIFDAVRVGDGEAAAAALAKHLDRSFNDLAVRFTGTAVANPFAADG